MGQRVERETRERESDKSVDSRTKPGGEIAEDFPTQYSRQEKVFRKSCVPVHDSGLGARGGGPLVVGKLARWLLQNSGTGPTCPPRCTEHGRRRATTLTSRAFSLFVLSRII